MPPGRRRSCVGRPGVAEQPRRYETADRIVTGGRERTCRDFDIHTHRAEG